jgi:hypothetical protein
MKNAAINADNINSPHSDKVGMDAGTAIATKVTLTVQDALTGFVV